VSVIGAGCLFSFLRLSEGHLQQTMEDLDRNDPGWRLDQIEANRKVVPVEENSARQIDAVQMLGMPLWTPAQEKELDAAVKDLSSEVRLPEKVVALLRDKLKKSAPALAEARKLAGMPNGRFPITYAADGISTRLPHVQRAREVADFLKHDAMLRGAEGDVDGALKSGRAIVNAGRSLSDEPFMITQLVRVACTGVALRSIERSLAQGEPSEASLAALAGLLTDEEAQPLLLIATRGERAIAERLLRALREGNISSLTGLGFGPASRIQIGNIDVSKFAYRWYLRNISDQHAALLEYASAVVESAKLPVEQQLPQLEQVAGAIVNQPFLVRMLAPASNKFAQMSVRNKAGLRCAIVAVALERYRRQHSRWPDSLNALVPEYLPCLPTEQRRRRGRWFPGPEEGRDRTVAKEGEWAKRLPKPAGTPTFPSEGPAPQKPCGTHWRRGPEQPGLA
jgi:hypothetical protein